MTNDTFSWLAIIVNVINLLLQKPNKYFLLISFMSCKPIEKVCFGTSEKKTLELITKIYNDVDASCRHSWIKEILHFHQVWMIFATVNYAAT